MLGFSEGSFTREHPVVLISDSSENRCNYE